MAEYCLNGWTISKTIDNGRYKTKGLHGKEKCSFYKSGL